MTAAELINSGLLEAYVLGQASPDEAALVERMRATEPSVGQEINAIEAALESQALRGAVTPSPAVKSAILDRIAKEAVSDTPILKLPQGEDGRRSSGINWLAAASVAALVLSAAMNFLQYRELHEVRGELARLENDRSVLAEELKVQRTAMERADQQLAVVLDPRAEVVRLNGMGAAEGKSARIYWDKAELAVHFDPQAMPAPPEGMQYQLWALVDGQPVDAGMIALETGVPGLQRMKDIPEAQAFAVTVEKAGGSPTPNLSALVLMGQV